MTGMQSQVSQGVDLGPNFERLEEERPELVNALRELVRQYRARGRDGADARDSADSPGAAFLARVAVRLVEPQ